MRITKSTAEMPEERYKALAIFMGWNEQIMTTTESPNYEIPNPQSFTEYLIEKDSAFMLDWIKRFNMQEAELQAKAKQDEATQILEDAKIQAEQIAN